ncbi:MAG: conjugal transfer protein TraF [Elusimicrobia bacterium]|nr:conjugal transfer protein TraF [Elusimicrobiota bacterium]
MRKNFAIVFVFAFFCLLFTGYIYSESFKILGTRPLGMGGAYVAIGEDAITQYWNPAGLGIGRDVDVQLPVNIQAEFTGDILGSANRLSDIADQFSSISAAQKTGKAISLDQLSAFVKGVKELDNLNDPSKGVLVDLGAGGNIRVSHFAFSVNNFTSIGADPSIDIKNLGLGAGSFSPQIKKSVYKAESYQGVDLGKIIDDFNSTYKTGNSGANIYDTPTDASLQTSANTLAEGLLTDITTNLKNLNIDTTITATLPAGLTVEQALANAIVRAATDPTIANQLGTTVLTKEQVKDYIQQIEDVRPLIDSILGGATAGSSYANNKSNLTVRGASTFEASLGYGMKVPRVQSTAVLNGILKGLYAGINVKYIKGYVGYVKVGVLNQDNVDLWKDFSDNQRTSNAIGVDLGFLLQKKFFNKKTNFGLLIRNLNSPTFDQPVKAINDGEGSKYKIDPQIRGGIAVWPFNWWSISTDLDLTENSTPLPGYNSQLWGLGTELNILNKSWFNLALRTGVMKNIAESSAKLAYTGGFGLNIAHFVIDVGGAMSSDMVDIGQKVSGSSTKVPAAASAALTISFDF